MTPSRRAGIACIFVLTLLVITLSGAWFWATSQMTVAWESWQTQAAAQGLQVQAAPPIRAGWPFAAELAIPGILVDAGLATWQADELLISLSPFHPTTVALSIHGKQSLRVDGLAPIGITARGLEAAVPLRDPQRATFEGHSLTADTMWGTLEIGVLAGRIDPAGIEVAASHLTVPQAGLPFGGAIERASARFRTTAPLMSASGMRPAGGVPGNPRQRAPMSAAEAAAAWARAGGEIVVDDATVLWGPLDAKGQFTAGLDAELQPVAHGKLHMTGYHEVVDSLVRAGTISRNAARVVTTVLDMMATSTDPAEVEVPLMLQGGVLKMGAIPLARIRPFTWP
jgi:hypothetical protein